MFENVLKLDYLGMEQKQSQQGNFYNIITLGNSASYEKYPFYADPSITISAGVGVLCVLQIRPYSVRECKLPVLSDAM